MHGGGYRHGAGLEVIFIKQPIRLIQNGEIMVGIRLKAFWFLAQVAGDAHHRDTRHTGPLGSGGRMPRE